MSHADILETQVGKLLGQPGHIQHNAGGVSSARGRLPEEPQTRSISAENPATSAATTDKHFEGDTVFGLHCTAGTVRGWRRPMANTQIVPTMAVAAIGIMASGKLPVSAWIQPIR